MEFIKGREIRLFSRTESILEVEDEEQENLNENEVKEHDDHDYYYNYTHDQYQIEPNDQNIDPKEQLKQANVKELNGTEQGLNASLPQNGVELKGNELNEPKDDQNGMDQAIEKDSQTNESKSKNKLKLPDFVLAHKKEIQQQQQQQQQQQNYHPFHHHAAVELGRDTRERTTSMLSYMSGLEEDEIMTQKYKYLTTAVLCFCYFALVSLIIKYFLILFLNS